MHDILNANAPGNRCIYALNTSIAGNVEVMLQIVDAVSPFDDLSFYANDFVVEMENGIFLLIRQYNAKSNKTGGFAMGRIQIFITNVGQYNEGFLVGEWVKLPVDKCDLQHVLDRIGINERYEEYFITDYEALLPNLHIGEYASISDLNDFAERIDSLADCDYNKLAAVLESEGSEKISEILELMDELDNFELLEGVDTDYTIGEYFADDTFLLYGVPDYVKRYFDFESYGRDIRLELNCCVTSYGLVVDNR